jgi:hypothetical protein
MRLLNRNTQELDFFPDKPYPRFSILSHTWGPTGTEITYRDMQEGQETTKPASYSKLRNTCVRAAADDVDYVWIDNFCIDKESSAELSESINSMFTWYRDAVTCYAYMADVPAGEDPRTSEAFAQSRWFKRGWTLQELIAPSSVTFYSQDWTVLGTRSDLAGVISRITRIDEGILTGLQDLKYVSVAKRMSWAADRETTRREDIAYCLMGLFDVNMAMLYGEGGEKAFLRLQEEIMKDSDDETLFAWTNTREEQPELQGLLATSPKDFRNSSGYIPDYDRGERVPHATTSRGLRITLGMQRLEGDVWIGSLECPVPPAFNTTLAIYLKLLDKQSKQYARIKADRLCKIPQRGPHETIYVRQNPLIPGFDDVFLHHVFQLRKIEVYTKGSPDVPRPLSEHNYELTEVLKHPLTKTIAPLPTSAPKGLPLITLEIPRGSNKLAGVLIIRRPDGLCLLVMLGSKPGFGVGVNVIPMTELGISSEAPKRKSFAASEQPGYTPGMFSIEQLEKYFDPNTPGSWFDMGEDRYRVKIDARRHAGIRYYMMDIAIAITPASIAPADLMLKDNAIPGLSTTLQGLDALKDGHVSNGQTKKWKRMFASRKEEA